MPWNPLKPETTEIAEGVWRHAGDLRQGMNVILIADGDGVTVFDGGTKRMTNGVREAAGRIGPIKRHVLSHGHPDHRGIAPGLGAPVVCHPAERADVEGDGGMHYFRLDEIPLRFPRMMYPILLPHWDGGPVEVSGTIAEGDELCGFEVLHFPGHAPGLIGLWRERDRLAIVSDVVYVVDPLRFKPAELPNVPDPVFNHDTAEAIASVRKLAALEPRIVVPGHHEPLTGERQQVRALLEDAADRAEAELAPAGAAIAA